MTPLDSWTLIAFFCGVFTIVTLLIDRAMAWFVRWVNKVIKRYSYALMYGASKRMAWKIALGLRG